MRACLCAWMLLAAAAPITFAAGEAASRGENDPRLQRRLPELRLNGTELAKAIDVFRDLSGENFFVDWAALEAAHVDRKTPVTLDEHNARVIDCLQGALDAAGKDLGLRVKGGVVLISTKRKIEHPTPIARLPRGDDPITNARATLTLDRKLPQVDFHGLALAEAFQYLQDQTKLQFVADWDRLSKAGIKRDTPVTLRLKNVSAADAIEYVIRSVAGDAPVQYALRDGAVSVSTADQFDADRMTRTFDVSDLLPEVARQAATDRLLRKVKEAMAPVTGDDRRPTSALLNGDHLVVTQTPENIKAVAVVLADLRDERDRR